VRGVPLVYHLLNNRLRGKSEAGQLMRTGHKFQSNDTRLWEYHNRKPAPVLKKLAMNRDTLRIIASLIVQPQEYYRTLELVLKKHKGRRFRSHILLRPREVGFVSICILM
jgi:hypothetical protein